MFLETPLLSAPPEEAEQVEQDSFVDNLEVSAGEQPLAAIQATQPQQQPTLEEREESGSPQEAQTLPEQPKPEGEQAAKGQQADYKYS